MSDNQDFDTTHNIRSSLKKAKVLTTQDDIYGIPSKVFLAGIGMSLAFSISVHWALGLAFAVLFFPAMYSIHENDPKALMVWIGSIRRRHTYWSAGRYKSVELYIIRDEFAKPTNSPKPKNK